MTCDRPPRLDRRAIDVLFQAVETPEGVITASALDHFQGAGPALKGSGLLRLKDHQPAAASLADHDDEPVALIWSPERRSYGYFSPSAGWVSVPGEQLAIFGVAFETLFGRLLERLDLSPRSPPVALAPDLLWEAGQARLPGRGRRAPLWIGRRLGDPRVWSRLLDAARARPAPGLRIVLSLTPAERLPAEAPPGHAVIAVRDVAGHGGLAVDPELLGARVAASPRRSDEPIAMAVDGAAITVRGTRYGFRGSKQRAVVRQLYDAWRTGEPERLTVDVLTAAGYSDSVNTLAKAFSGRTDWRDFIKEEGGRCWMAL